MSILLIVLVLMNTYPLLVSEDLVFRAKATSLQNSVSVMVYSLSGLDRLTQGAMAESVRHIVGVQFRNMATLGGSLWSRFGFSDLTCALLALDATVVLYRGGEVPLAQFMATPISFDDILLKVRIRDDGRRAAYQSARRSSTDFPTMAVAVSCLDGRWTVSVGARPARAVRSEQAARCLNDGLGAAAAGQAAAEELTYGTDLRAGADYRRKLAAVLVRRAAEQCMEENKG